MPAAAKLSPSSSPQCLTCIPEPLGRRALGAAGLGWLGLSLLAPPVFAQVPKPTPSPSSVGPKSTAEKRMALVVGNARYAHAPLNNPENDARVVGSTLRRLGFDVQEHVNVTVKEFRRVLREFARRLQHEDGVGVFYYAGHGVQIAGRNYLLPIDVNLRDEDEVRDESVDVDELFIGRLEKARAAVRIVILDACRDNPFGEKTRSLDTRGINSGLAEMAARGALIAYASAPGATAEDGPPGTNSIYTRHLVKEMLAEGVEVEQMFKNVRVQVLRDTRQRQVPWVNTSMTANFSFNPGPDKPPIAQREDIARLQSLLDQRDREQQRLEAEIERLRASMGHNTAATPKPAPTAERKNSVTPRTETAQGHTTGLPSRTPPTEMRPERCVELLTRAQLGEQLTASEIRDMQKECR